MRPLERTLKLGTRDSLLAMAQSRIVTNTLIQRNPGLRIELVPMKTRGDRNRKTPLSEARDTEFFSSELDAALVGGEVDFCVHSLKDLGPRRPDAIIRAAIPERENPRDVIVFRPSVIERLRRGLTIRIGSSSKRRQYNVAAFLRDALPDYGHEPGLEFWPIRGPVDQRLTRIKRDEQDPDALDGIVLALAGLARLWGDAAGRRAIEPLLSTARWLVLPLSACPTAPGQGALAVECRASDESTRTLLNTIHDPDSAALVAAELETVAEIPESERSGLGATALTQEKIGRLMYVRGGDPDNRYMAWQKPPRPENSRAWDGGELLKPVARRSLPVDSSTIEGAAVFVAHWHAVTDKISLRGNTRVWTSGIRSWQQLARRGVWVEGCADNLGFSDILPTLACGVLRLPRLPDWRVLTHSRATQSWHGTGVGQVQATYELKPVVDIGASPELRRRIATATHFFWGSIEQYHRAKQWLPERAHHACGTGKTAQALKETGVTSPHTFPSRKEWLEWLR